MSEEYDLVEETEKVKGIFIDGIKYFYSINKLTNIEESISIKLYDPSEKSNLEFTYEASIEKLTKDIKFFSSCDNTDEILTSLNELFSSGYAKVEKKNENYILELIFIGSGIRKNYFVPLI